MCTGLYLGAYTSHGVHLTFGQTQFWIIMYVYISSLTLLATFSLCHARVAIVVCTVVIITVLVLISTLILPIYSYAL